MPLASKLFRGDPDLEAAAVSDPAHIVPGAAGPHVNKIQQALIELDGADIAQDGSYGPETAAAVLAYKRKRSIINRNYQTQADDIVGRMTVAALDKEMREKEGPAGTAEILARAPDGTCSLQRSFPQTSAPGVNPNVVAAATALLPQVRTAIRAANFHLLVAEPHVTHQKQQLPTGAFNAQARASLSLLDKVFDFFKFADPRPAFDNFRVVYKNMDVALNRSFETAPLIAPTLYVANPVPSMETQAAAYTSHGGAFFSPDTRNKLNIPANRIYLCQNLLNPSRLSQMMTLVHELAHFVSGPVIEIVDNNLRGHYFATDPPDLQAPPGSVSPQFQALATRLKIRNAEHYAAFAMMAAARRLA
jgi:peptidoglycan hydrolase-like protein with peptidoglycan-binding domain